MTWWCSSSGQAWTWAWQAYPGAWVLVALFVTAYVATARRVAFVDAGNPPSRFGITAFCAGVVAFWLAVDWPIGALGAGYLLSVHQLQYVLLVMVAPPLMLLGATPSMLRELPGTRTLQPVLRFLARPINAILACNVVVVLTHFPLVVDRLMQFQLGSFVLDMSWFVAGLILWWPVLQRVGAGNTFTYPMRFVYLLVATLIPGVPSAFFFFARFPIYRTYELAPPMGLATLDDQFIGGAVMKLGSFVVILIALSILFYRWHASDRSPTHKLVLPEGTAEAQR